MVGAGFMGRGLPIQSATAVPGMRLAAIANRNIEAARRAYEEAGHPEIREAGTPGALAAAIDAGVPAVTDDWRLLCRDPRIDVVIEVTGSIDYAAAVTLSANENGKHVALMKAELDGPAGPLRKGK